MESRLISLMVVAITIVSTPAFARKGSSYSTPSSGSHSVRGHIRKDGTYVQPYRATNQNVTQRDNWSSKPNVNPYTGAPGTKEPQR